MAKESAPLLYTTQAEIESIVGPIAVILQVDDDETGAIDGTESTLVDDAIWEATDTFNEYALHYYTAEVLETSGWVRRRVSYMAAHLLGRRRGNPSIYCEEYDKILEELKQIQLGLLHIPRMAKRADFTPKMSNLVVDQNYTKSKIRVDSQTSVGDTDSEQDLDYLGSRDYYY